MKDDRYDDARDLIGYATDRLANVEKALPHRPQDAISEIACLEMRIAQLKQLVFEAL